jgi:hypothetical protein
MIMTQRNSDRRPQVEIVAVPPAILARKGWLFNVLELAGGLLPGINLSEPTRVLVRYGDRERLLFREDSFEQAKEKVERVAAEYEALDPHEWCKRYRVPEDFFAD